MQDIEFAQIEMKVIEGLKTGNECLKKMHEVHFLCFCCVLISGMCQRDVSFEMKE